MAALLVVQFQGPQAPSMKVEEEDVPQALVVKDSAEEEEVPQALTFCSIYCASGTRRTWNPNLAYRASLGQNLRQRPD